MFRSASMWAVVWAFISTATLHAQTPVTIREWDVPTANSGPHDPAIAPDGALWYTGQASNRLGRLDPLTGRIDEFTVPTPSSGPHGLVADRDGNIWFTGNAAGYIGKLDPRTGTVTNYPMPDPRARDPHTPVFDAKGTLWFTVQIGNFVGKLDPATGSVTLRSAPTPNSRPYGIVLAASGVPFFTEFGSNKIGSIDPSTMEITEYALPLGARPRRLAIAPDGRVYYTDYARGYLGRLNPADGRVDEWRSPGGSGSNPYGIASTADGAIWYSESGVSPNTLIRFDPAAETFETWPIPSGGGVLRHIVSTPGGQLYLACSGVNKVGVAYVFSSLMRGAAPNRGVLSRSTLNADGSGSTTVGHARIDGDTVVRLPHAFAIFTLRQSGLVVAEAAVPATPLTRSGRVHVEMDTAVKTGVAISNPNGQPAAVRFYFTDANGRNYGEGALTIPPNGQVAQFLDEAPFQAAPSALSTWTFVGDQPLGAIALRGLTNERGEFLISTVPVVDLAAPAGIDPAVFPHFADGGGWTSELVLINPTENAVRGRVAFTRLGQSVLETSYAIAARGSTRVRTPGTSSSINTGLVRVTPDGTATPGGALIVSFRRDGVTVSEASFGIAPPATEYLSYVETGDSVSSGIAIANAGRSPTSVTAELYSESGERLAVANLGAIPVDGQLPMFVNEIAALRVPRHFSGILRLTSSEPEGIIVAGLRGRTNERGDFLLATTPPQASTMPVLPVAAFPHIADGGGYSTQFVFFTGIGRVTFFNQAGQRLGLALR